MELNKTYQFPTKTIFFWYIRTILWLLLFSAIFLLGGIKAWFGVAIWLIIFFGIPFLIYFYLAYKNISFIVEENKITINRGVIAKKSTSIIFNSVQNVTIASNPIAKMFDLSVVRIWTASPGQNKEKLPDGILCLATLDAEWLKNFITAKRPSTS